MLDTSVMIAFFRRDGSPGVKLAVCGLLDEFEATLCGPVEMEFLGGALPGERERLKTWLGLLPYARNGQKLWRAAGDAYSRMRAEGVTIPWNDALIACIALEQDCRVYAIDRHFEAMAGILGIRLYAPGYNGSYTFEIAPGSTPVP